jgi:hypothetical protein
MLEIPLPCERDKSIEVRFPSEAKMKEGCAFNKNRPRNR